MKIRTDFVTNSSSSSFIAATIETKDEDFMELIRLAQHANIHATSNQRIQIRDNETACGFNYKDMSTPEGVVDAILSAIRSQIKNGSSGAALLQEIYNNPQKTADSIPYYHIIIGEKGNAGEAECLCDEYIDSLVDEDTDWDEVYDAFMCTDGYAQKKETYTYTRGAQNPISISEQLSGSLDDGW